MSTDAVTRTTKKQSLSKQSSESPSQYNEQSLSSPGTGPPTTNVILLSASRVRRSILQSTRRSIEKDDLWRSVCDNFRCM